MINPVTNAQAEPSNTEIEAKDSAGIKSSVETLAPFAHLGWRGRHPLPVWKVATSVPASHERATGPEMITPVTNAQAEPARRFVHAKDSAGIKSSVETLASFCPSWLAGTPSATRLEGSD